VSPTLLARLIAEPSATKFNPVGGGQNSTFQRAHHLSAFTGCSRDPTSRYLSSAASAGLILPTAGTVNGVCNNS
jgi:hypothetical protein